jgi:hypothetical protein
MSSPLFLPWLRRGLSRGSGGEDVDAAALPLRAAIKAVVGLRDSRGVEADAGVTLPLLGPGDVVGVDGAQVVRMVPADGATDVAANYLPFVELAVPDLPWMFTPAQATATNRLRPWLVLVCVELRDGIDYDANGQPLPVLRLSGDDAAVELPDLAESWAWVHVQSMVRGQDIAAEVERGTGAVTARLLCPRRLHQDRTYRAALVPAFDVGRAAGLGEDVLTFSEAGPAWRHGALPPVVELPVYATWTFTTSAEPGDFEELARRLQPDTEGGRMGFHAARVVDVGLLEPFDGDTRFEYEGTLVDPGAVGAELRPPAGTWFRSGMRRRLDEAARRPSVSRQPPADYDPQADDPVLGPPYYGSWAAGADTPAQWLDELNLNPDRRAAAGLGARVVREHQHEYLAAAWDQAGDVRALQEELNRGRLAAEVGRSHARRLAGLSDAALLQATQRIHVFIPVGGRTAAERLQRSVIMPAAMTSPAFARQTRPGAVLARRAGRTRHRPTVGTRAVRQFTAASVVADARTAALEPIARFGGSFVAADTVTVHTAFVLVQRGGPDSGATEIVAVEAVPAVASAPADDVTAVAGLVRDALDPMASIVAGLDRRLSGVRLDPSADLPTRIPVGPRFADPLFPRLHAMGSDLVVPGIEAFGANRVRLLAVNEAWIAAFHAGANHEWAREALWNEYPADLGATAFSTFWPRVPAGTTDLAKDMHEWRRDESLADQVGSAGSSTVLLIRGDLIRRHPDAELLMVTPSADGALVAADGSLPPERTTWPAFTGRLDAQTIVVGFDVDPQQVWDERRYIGIQEPVTGPRFGLDETASDDGFGTAPASWSDLSWTHVAASADALAALTHIRLADTTWLGGVRRGQLEWARNSAHLAGITFQQPFRLLLPATYLMPSPEGRT